MRECAQPRVPSEVAIVSLAILILASSRFRFEGESLEQLAGKITEARSESTSILCGDTAAIRRMAFSWETPEEFNKEICRLSRYRSDKLLCAYYPVAWPSYMLGLRPRDPESQDVPETEDWPVDESGTLEARALGGVRCRMADLQKVGNKPVSFNWFFLESIICFAGKGELSGLFPQFEKALGATILDDEDSVKIEIAPAAYRARMLVALKDQEAAEVRRSQIPHPTIHQGVISNTYEPLDEMRILNLRMGSAALEVATNQQIKDAFESDDHELHLVVPKTGKVLIAVNNRLKGFINQKVVVMPGQVTNQEFVDAIDWKQPVEVKFHLKSLTASVYAFVKGRPGYKMTF